MTAWLAMNGKEAMLGTINPKPTKALRFQSARDAAQMPVAATTTHGAHLGMNIIQNITPAGRTSRVIRSARGSNPHSARKGRKGAKQLFAREQMDAWLRERGVQLVGGDLDESPMAYRRLPEVLAQHAGSIRVLHTLRPFAVAMAGEGEFDPFKD